MNGKESVNEAIKPQGYSQLNTMAKHAGIYIRDLLKALRKQDDDAVIREVHFLAAQFTTMEKMLKDKKWNAKYSESVNEAVELHKVKKEIIAKLSELIRIELEGTCGYAPDGKIDVHNTDKLTPAGPHLLKKKKKNESVILMKNLIKK